MNWRFTLQGRTVREGGYFGTVPGAGSAGTPGMAWTLHAVPDMPPHLKRRMGKAGKAALLKAARELCEKDGGLLLVVEEGRCVSAWQWRDAGEQDPEASGHYVKFELDPRDFKNVV